MTAVAWLSYKSQQRDAVALTTASTSASNEATALQTAGEAQATATKAYTTFETVMAAGIVALALVAWKNGELRRL